MLGYVTVVVGNRDEVEVAVGTARPARGGRPAARARRRAGPGQDGRRGRARRDRREPHRRAAAPGRGGLRPRRRRRVRRRARARAAVRLGARPRSRSTPTPPARSSPPGWPAPTRCPPSRSSTTSSRSRGGATHDRHRRHRPAARGPTLDRRRMAARCCERRATDPERRRARLRRAPPPEPAAVRARHALPGRRRPPGPRLARHGRRPDGDGRPALAAGPAGRRRWQHPDVDGVLGTPDVVEELLLLGALEGKVVIGSMNRGGLDGATWTMDDRFTGYDAASIAAYRLEGGKMLLRIDDQDAGTAAHPRGLRPGGHRARRARPGRDGRAAALPPRERRLADPAQGRAGRWPGRSPIASALGTTSAHTWLKMPACDDPEVGLRGHHAAVRRARRRARARTRPATSRRGAARWRSRPCADSSSAGRCCTRPTATSAPPWTPRPQVLRPPSTRSGPT